MEQEALMWGQLMTQGTEVPRKIQCDCNIRVSQDKAIHKSESNVVLNGAKRPMEESVHPKLYSVWTP